MLRIDPDESAFFCDQRVFEFIAELARQQKLAGVTVLEAVLGFGRSAHLHRRHALENDRAVVIEIIDEETRLRSFSAQPDEIPDIGLITLDAVDVRGGKSAAGPHDVQSCPPSSRSPPSRRIPPSPPDHSPVIKPQPPFSSRTHLPPPGPPP